MGRGKTDEMNKYADRLNRSIESRNTKLSNASYSKPPTPSDKKTLARVESEQRQDNASNFRKYEVATRKK